MLDEETETLLQTFEPEPKSISGQSLLEDDDILFVQQDVLVEEDRFVEQDSSVEQDILIDHSEPNWPEWLLERYGSLELPSLHDFLFSQEKLNVEIRMQNRELKNTHELVQTLADRIEAMNHSITEATSSTECDEGDEEDYDFENHVNQENEWQIESGESVKQQPEVVLAQQILMQSMDSLLHLFEGIEIGNQRILRDLPLKSGFFRSHKPSWRTGTEEVLDSYLQGIHAMKHKLHAQLADLGVDLIKPAMGDPFDPSTCRAVERINGTQHNGIAQVIRYGYRINGKIVRFADVSIYN